LPENILERIDAIRRDKTSGSIELSRRATEVLLEVARHSRREAVVTAGRALVDAQPAMAAVFNLVNSVLLADGAETAAQSFLKRLDESALSVSRHAGRLLADGMTVLTHSYSETVLRALRDQRGIHVICTESRPMNEGVSMAKALAAAGVRVTLATDAAMFSLVPSAQLVLVGADAVSPEAVVNKTGTALLALAARESGVRIYAVCGSEKFLPPGVRLPAEPPRDPAEVLRGGIPNVTVWNRYFEATPLRRFTGIVSDEGILTADEAANRLARTEVHPVLASKSGPTGLSGV